MNSLFYQATHLLRVSAFIVFALLALQACQSEQEPTSTSKTEPSTSLAKTTNQAAPAVKPSSSQATMPSGATPQSASITLGTNTEGVPAQVQCKSGTLDLATELFRIAKSLEGVDYTQNPSSALQDCSGMFHRVVQKFSETCPGYELPSSTADRQSVAIGKWYADKNLFTVVTAPLQQAHLITEGVVLFFGHQKKQYSAQELGSPHKAVENINHLGVVVKTEKRDGVVVQYHMFHGRQPGKKSAITSYHSRQPRSTPNFPFGNGAEQLIGLAPLVNGTPTL
jgi:hypothetical protein